jgi:hypothetical protein
MNLLFFGCLTQRAFRWVGVIAALLLATTLTFAAPATPVNISSIAVSGSTVTVNATAHGIAANRGFCLSAQSYCGTASTSAANSFTFSVSNGTIAACASSCGTVSPAKQIIGLNITIPPNQIANFVCWLATSSPAATTTKSSWNGATVAENNAISAGTTIEVVPQAFPVAGATVAAFKAYAQQQCTNLQSSLDSGIAPAFLLGNYFDGSGWLN